MEELQGKLLEGNNLGLYREGSRLSVDTFGVAACSLRPEADVLFPCGACACALLTLCVDTTPSHPDLLRLGCGAAAE